MTNHIMLDLETLGTRPGSTILSIGAVVFAEEGVSQDPARQFYRVASRSSCRDAGLTEDPSTLAWWQQQSDLAKKVITEATGSESLPLAYVLGHLVMWFQAAAPIAGVWSHGAAFDLPILSEAFRRCGFNAPPWNYQHEFCHRTLTTLGAPKTTSVPNTGTAHHALDDATWQATNAVNYLRALKVW